jgi:hypothetical protein
MKMSVNKKLPQDPLLQKDDEVVKKELQRLRSAGQLQDVTRVIAALRTQQSIDLSNEIISFLSDIKEEGIQEILVNEIRNPDNLSITRQLIEICWQSGLDYTPHLEFITDLFLTGDYATAIEAFSLIETSMEEQQPDAETARQLVEKIKTVLFDLTADMKILAVELIHVLEA